MPEPVPEWRMPEWMEPYRDLFRNTGGNSIERLMTLPPGTGRSNVILAALGACAESQVGLLHALHHKGLLRERMMEVKRDA